MLCYVMLCYVMLALLREEEAYNYILKLTFLKMIKKESWPIMWLKQSNPPKHPLYSFDSNAYETNIVYSSVRLTLLRNFFSSSLRNSRPSPSSLPGSNTPRADCAFVRSTNWIQFALVGHNNGLRSNLIENLSYCRSPCAQH